jgi:cobalt/nickel transport system permease protein
MTRSPFDQITPQAKLIAAVVTVVGIVLSTPPTPFKTVAIILLVMALAVVARVSIGQILRRSLLVLPVAGGIAVLAPLRFVETWSPTGIAAAYWVGWPQLVAMSITPWLCVLVMMLLIQICPQRDMLYAFERLHIPEIFVLLLTFMYRYVDVMRGQLQATRRALVSRAPTLTVRRQVPFYGNLAGSMLIRAYDRGERIYAAMLSRGFTGTLPRTGEQKMGHADAFLIACATLLAVALLLYR